MDGRPISILLVEDDPDDAFLFRRTLEDVADLAFELQIARRLAEGLEMLADGEFDVVLLDLSLPDSQGLDTFRGIQDRAPELPIVVLTGLDDEETAVTAVQRGAQDYLVKGETTSGILVRSIRYAVERQQTVRYRRILIERERFDTAVAQMSDGVLVTDGVGLITSANRAAQLLLNLPETGWRGTPLDDALAGFVVTATVADLLACPERVTAFDIARPDTQPPLYVSARLTRMFDDAGHLASTVVILRDVTDELHQRNIQTSFLMMVSHKLRTPLSIMLGYINSCSRLPEDRRQEQWASLIGVFGEQLNRLDDIVKRLLDFKALTTVDFEKEAEAASLAQAVHDVSDDVRQSYPDRTIEITTDISAGADCTAASAVDLIFVLEKLMDNAVKFSTGDIVHVRIASKPHDGAMVRVSVGDDGPGIPHEYADKIFEGFCQVEDHVTGQVPGLGLGLHLARRVVQAYDGAMWLETSLGEGSTFQFTLPAPQAPFPGAPS